MGHVTCDSLGGTEAITRKGKHLDFALDIGIIANRKA